jgi:hypothetical protein
MTVALLEGILDLCMIYEADLDGNVVRKTFLDQIQHVLESHVVSGTK